MAQCFSVQVRTALKVPVHRAARLLINKPRKQKKKKEKGKINSRVNLNAYCISFAYYDLLGKMAFKQSCSWRGARSRENPAQPCQMSWTFPTHAPYMHGNTHTKRYTRSDFYWLKIHKLTYKTTIMWSEKKRNFYHYKEKPQVRSATLSRSKLVRSWIIHAFMYEHYSRVRFQPSKWAVA